MNSRLHFPEARQPPSMFWVRRPHPWCPALPSSTESIELSHPIKLTLGNPSFAKPASSTNTVKSPMAYATDFSSTSHQSTLLRPHLIENLSSLILNLSKPSSMTKSPKADILGHSLSQISSKPLVLSKHLPCPSSPKQLQGDSASFRTIPFLITPLSIFLILLLIHSLIPMISPLPGAPFLLSLSSFLASPQVHRWPQEMFLRPTIPSHCTHHSGLQLWYESAMILLQLTQQLALVWPPRPVPMELSAMPAWTLCDTKVRVLSRLPQTSLPSDPC